MSKSQKGQPKKVYSREDHEKAYQLYFSSRNLSHVARQMSLSYQTVLQWKAGGFSCAFGCPFHDWDRMLNEQAAAMEAQFQLQERGVFDPLAQEQAIEVAVENAEQLPVAPLPVVRVRMTPEQELHHWFHLYAKTYFDLTGIALDYETWKEAQAGVAGIMREDLLKKGLRHTSAEGAIRTLAMIGDKLRALESQILGAKEIRTEAQAKEAKKLNPEEIRRLLTLTNGMPEEALKTLANGFSGAS